MKTSHILSLVKSSETPNGFMYIVYVYIETLETPGKPQQQSLGLTLEKTLQFFSSKPLLTSFVVLFCLFPTCPPPTTDFISYQTAPGVLHTQQQACIPNYVTQNKLLLSV